jgi:hypothetical protein
MKWKLVFPFHAILLYGVSSISMFRLNKSL